VNSYFRIEYPLVWLYRRHVAQEKTIVGTNAECVVSERSTSLTESEDSMVIVLERRYDISKNSLYTVISSVV
jgi:hypothetical protein